MPDIERCDAQHLLEDGAIALCCMEADHFGPIHISPGFKGATIWSTAPDDEQHESNDGEDHEDRPQHGGDSTPPVCAPLTTTYDLSSANPVPEGWGEEAATDFPAVFGYVSEYGGGRFVVYVHGSTESYPDGDVVTMPVHKYRWLLAHPPVTPEIQAVLDLAVRDFHRWQAGDVPARADINDAVRAYLASIEPPKPPEPFTASIDKRPNGGWAINAAFGGPHETWECEVRPIRKVEP